VSSLRQAQSVDRLVWLPGFEIAGRHDTIQGSAYVIARKTT
jgi:hypothetical protein